MPAALSVQDMHLSYGGITALRNITLTLPVGQTLGLIGPNGAGKTSFINVLSGFEAPSSGSIMVGSQTVTGALPHVIARAGIARTFQSVQVFSRLSVLDNVRVGLHRQSRHGGRFWAFPSALRDECDRATELLELFDLAHRANDLPASLTMVDLKKLEIARALISDPQIILFDEPAAGMTSQEADMLARVLNDKVLQGRSAIIIEHKTDFVASVAERTAVLKQGQLIADGPTGKILASADVRRIYLGRAVS